MSRGSVLAQRTTSSSTGMRDDLGGADDGVSVVLPQLVERQVTDGSAHRVTCRRHHRAAQAEQLRLRLSCEGNERVWIPVVPHDDLPVLVTHTSISTAFAPSISIARSQDSIVFSTADASAPVSHDQELRRSTSKIRAGAGRTLARTHTRPLRISRTTVNRGTIR